MERRADILMELQGISPVVAGINPVTPFKVPDGYFESIASQVLNRIRNTEIGPREELASLSPLLGSLSKEVPYQLPDGYFDSLSEHVLGGAKAIEFVNEELENLSPMMSDLKSKTVYQVPAGYFENLPENILKGISKPQQAKVRSINAIRKLTRYAAAAIVIGVVAVGGWLFYGESTRDHLVNGVRQATEEEMLSFIQNDIAPHSEAVYNAANAKSEMNQTDMKLMLEDVSDAELEQFASESMN